MDLIKLCPVCKAENTTQEILCIRCMANISGVEAIAKINPVKLKIQTEDNREFYFDSSFEIGRAHEICANSKDSKLISRKHASFIYQQNQWFISDLNSTNGTYLNNEKLTPDIKYKIEAGNIISLSSKFKINCYLISD